ETDAPAEAIRILREQYSALLQPECDLALASSFEAAGDRKQAAIYYQRVYYLYPLSDAAGRASAALLALQEAPPQPQQLLERASRLLAAREYSRARAEFESLASQLSGTERDQASVRIGAVN